MRVLDRWSNYRLLRVASVYAPRPSFPLANGRTAGGRGEGVRLSLGAPAGRPVNRACRAAAQHWSLDSLAGAASGGRSVAVVALVRSVGPSHYRSNLVEATAAAAAVVVVVPIGHDRVGRDGGPSVGRWRVIWRRTGGSSGGGGGSSAGACNMPSVGAITVPQAPLPLRWRRSLLLLYGCRAVSAAYCPLVRPFVRLSVRPGRAAGAECSAWLRSQINCRVVSALRPVQSDDDNVQHRVSAHWRFHHCSTCTYLSRSYSALLRVYVINVSAFMSNFISSPSDRKKNKLNNYTIQHNEKKSIDRLSSDRTSIKCHKIYKDNRESLNKRLLP